MRCKIAVVGALFLCLLPLVQADTALVFNEIMYHPQTNEAALEWVEFYNQMAVDLDVSGWTIQNGISYKFPEGSIVHGGGYIVVAISPTDLMAATGLTNVLGPFAQRLSNSGETLELRNNDGRLIDSLSYGVDGDWPVGPDGSGVSLAKLDPNSSSGPAENWTMSAHVGGTPGQTNFPTVSPSIDAGLVFNEISASTNSVFWLELFNASTNDIPLENYNLALQGSTNATYVFPAQTIAPGAFLALDESQLGFRPASTDKLLLYPPPQDRLLDAVVVKTRLRGRFPDGTGPWCHPDHATPAATNSFAFQRDIVINEIMYDHSPTQSISGLQLSDEQWVELYNRGSNTVNLTGWHIDGGIQYSFATGQTLAGGAYLVVAKHRADLQARYPAVSIVGDFSKSLSHHNDLIILKDANDDPVNQVHYFDEGRWPAYANREGSSLELRDPMADNSKAEAWAASDEAPKSSWSNYTYSAVAAGDGGPTRWNELVVGLLAVGECLIDDISVVELVTNQSPVQLIGNGDFENGLAGWRVLGNHNRTRVEVDPDNPGNHVLHVVATGPTEHMHNHIETTYLGDRSITNGRVYQVSFRARWVAGVNLLNTRLYFNRVHQTSVLPVPPLNGTPGAANSRLAPNIGPTFSQFQHRPVVPETNQAVTVSVVAQDPQGVASCSLWWAANGGSWSNSVMISSGDGVYTGLLPALPSATVVQFYVEATDGLGDVSTYPARGPDSRALYKVNDGQAALGLGHNIRIIVTPADTALLFAETNLMSNDNIGATVVCDEQRPYYDMGLRLKSSERGRIDPARVGFHLEFNRDDLFRGVHPVMLIDRSGVNGTFGQSEILVKHMMNHAGGFAQVYNDLCHVIAPQSIETGPAIFFPRFEDEFLSTQYPDGASGPLFEYELLYFPLTTLDGTPTGYKLPNPDDIIGVDISDRGDDKESYRYHYIIKNNREVDDYSRLIDLCKVFSLTGPALNAQSQRVMDVDQWMRAFVMESLCGVNEIYNSPGDDNFHNVLLYVRSSDQKVVTFPWDMDWCFVLEPQLPLVGERNLSKIINLPQNLRIYYAHALDIIASTYNPTYMASWVSHFNSFCPGQDFSSILPYIDARSTFARQTLARYSTNAFALSSTNEFSTGSDLITLTGTAPVQVRTILINGLAYPVTWVSITNWSLSLALNPGTNVFQIQGYDMRGNILSNAALSVTATYTNPPPNPLGVIVINEILYNPSIPDATFVELFNTSSNLSFDVTGWRVDGIGFTFPPMVMTNGQFVVLTKDLDAFAAAYGPAVRPDGVFGGRLDPNGETLSLIKPGATPAQDLVVDRVRYEPNAPWPENANGSGASLQLIDATQDNSRVSNWAAVLGVATPGAANSVTSTLPAYPPLWINEVQPNNIGGITDGSGDRDPWIELYNAGPEPVSLDGFFLASSYTNLAQWSFPTGTVINGGEYKVIFADGQPEQSTGTELHTSFRLSSVSGAIALSDSSSGAPRMVDYVNYSGVHSNLSFGSFPDGQPFYRQEFYYVTPGSPNNATLAPSGIFINEWMASNTGFIRDPADNATDDWFELYNPGALPVSLEGYFLTDNLTNKFQYRIPAGYSVPSLGFLLVWADKSPIQNSTNRPDLHVNFELSKNGEAIGLFAADGSQIDAVTFGPQTNNISQGRYPDGANAIYYMTRPSPRSINLPPFNNSPPTLAPLTNRVVFSNDTLSFIVSATDTDQPPQTLTFTLDPGAPMGAGIDATSGLFAWAPTPEQVPSTNTITVRVTDNGTPNLSATRSFQVLALNTNSAPALPLIDNQIINELALLVITNTAADADLPNTVLTYALIDPPPGASIDTNGIIRWTPNEAQGPGSYLLTTIVTDDGVPNLSASNSFSVFVNEVNAAPVLPTLPNRTINPTSLMSVTNTASDPDFPVNTLTYALVSPPDGATIDGSGIINWTPSTAQALASYTLTTVVTDYNPDALIAHSLSATNSFTVVVKNTNSPPILPVLEDRTINELTMLVVTNTATDADLPETILSYALVNPPLGATISTNGIITWVPGEDQGPGTNVLITVVTDDGVPHLSATNSFTVVINEINMAPTLPTVADMTVLPLTLLTVTNTAADGDLPVNTLTYSLIDPPDGASIDGAGIITWYPAETQSPGSYPIVTRVTDYNPNAINEQHLSATNRFIVTINETRPLLNLLTAADGGTITLAPAGGRYPNGTVVQLTALPSPGWVFLGWWGDLDGSNAVATLTMNRGKSVRAVFGTYLTTSIVGKGSIALYPTNLLCAYGATVQLAAVPAARRFLSAWNVTTGNVSTSTNVNPLNFMVVNPQPAFEAVFESLDTGQVTLAVVPNGRGQVQINPQTNVFNRGDTVHLSATPDPGQKFLGWSGDETNSSASFDVTLKHSETVTANFSKRPWLEPLVNLDGVRNEGMRMILFGDAGTDYAIQGSSNLVSWTNVAVVNSPYGAAQITDGPSTNLAHRLYRALSPPDYVPPPPLTLIATGSVWKYLDNGSNQGTNWVANAFNDSTWASGPAQLGYGDGDEATLVSFGPNEANKYITTYFRRSFNVTNAAAFVALTLHLLRDDGGVVYLNGKEAFRSNMGEGTVSYSTLAAGAAAGFIESTFFPGSIDPALLVNGTNVLAVEIHQVSPDSSDISFDLELIGQQE